ncbi:hypothetical protein G9A89_010201 [Geosiphon pyriformis]|nr:hypothetical protein G9A89_010201 [Geosiphon pyriformis]
MVSATTTTPQRGIETQTIRARMLKRMRDFTSYQGTRVALYKEFQEAFTQNLNFTDPEHNIINNQCTDAEFALICRITTEGFNEVSRDIQAVEREMKNIGDIGQQAEQIELGGYQMSENIIDHGELVIIGQELGALIRVVQELEKQKLKLTVNTQIYMKQAKTQNSKQDFGSLIKDTQQSLSEIVEQINEAMQEIHEVMTEL